jgi:aminoglycoside 3-N-acetyltransferase I
MSDLHHVRVLGAEDVAAFREMLGVFAEAFDESDTYLDRQPDDAYLARLLGSDGFVAVAALSRSNDVIGGLAAYVLPKFEQVRRELFIYDLAVAERYRRQGIATDLIAAVQRLAADRGIYVIFVQADEGDDAAVALYSRVGAREDVLHFDIQPRVPPN